MIEVTDNAKIETLFTTDMDIIQKADSNEDSYRIKGIASTERIDRDGETIIQKGLDFSQFLKFGWYNDNHKSGPSAKIGYPEIAEFRKSHWYTEGYLLKGVPVAEEYWNLAKALSKSNGTRKLGFSIEGKVVKRQNNKILKAIVRHIAVTAEPVNPDCTLDILVKSFCANCESDICTGCTDGCSVMNKALEAGHESGTDVQDGSALRNQSLDGNVKKQCGCGSGKKCSNCKSKKMNKAMVVNHLINEKGLSEKFANRFADLLMKYRNLENILKRTK